MKLKCYEYEWNFDESNGRLTCKRHGIDWRDETGDGAVLALLMTACDLMEQLEGAKNTERQLQPNCVSYTAAYIGGTTIELSC